ncbi:ATP-binding protein [Euzebya sp.]|uniref:sensor histidine kinase n=1 Tax=Euzebya sp. TaxID=1971409 RepID=UPI003518B4AC
MRSLRGRVALVASLVVALGFVLTGVVVLRVAEDRAVDRLDDQLAERLAILTDAGRPGPGFGGGPPGGFGGFGGFGGSADGTGEADDDADDDQDDDADDEGWTGPSGAPLAAVQRLRLAAERSLGRGYFLAVRGPGGGTLATLGDEPANDPPAGADGDTATYVDDAGRRWRVMTATVAEGLAQLQIGGDVDQLVEESVASLRLVLVVVGGTATVVTGLATAAAAAASTRPLRRLGEATRTVAETRDLSTRVPTDGVPAEVAEVSDALNTMLGRLEAADAAQRSALHGAQRFAADAGHELRTPLTALQADLDALVRNPAAPAAIREEALAAAAAEVRRLSALLASLQALARADAGMAEPPGPVDLADVAAQAVESVARRHPSVRLDPPAVDGSVVVRGSEAWLRSTCDNLLVNAAVHGRADGHVVTRVRRTADGVELVVDDDGPGIPATQREAVVHRFVRGADADDRPGSGLGLSLVAQLVALHGGRVALGDSPLGGLRVAVTLPAA